MKSSPITWMLILLYLRPFAIAIWNDCLAHGVHGAFNEVKLTGCDKKGTRPLEPSYKAYLPKVVETAAKILFIDHFENNAIKSRRRLKECRQELHRRLDEDEG